MQILGFAKPRLEVCNLPTIYLNPLLVLPFLAKYRPSCDSDLHFTPLRQTIILNTFKLY